MKKIKLFRSSSFAGLEDEVNVWLSVHGDKVENIKYSTAGNSQQIYYSVMIVYSEPETGQVFDPNSISAG